jgi:hypothetical protein
MVRFLVSNHNSTGCQDLSLANGADLARLERSLNKLAFVASSGATGRAVPPAHPPDLWTELEKWAAAELRSVNGQIEYLLRQAVEKRKRAQAEEK